jgi:hypothetical protein
MEWASGAAFLKVLEPLPAPVSPGVDLSLSIQSTVQFFRLYVYCKGGLFIAVSQTTK